MLKKEQQYWVKTLSKIDYPTPFKLTNLSKVRAKVETLKKVLPEVDIYYAIKSSSEPEIITAIDDLVAGYDIASLGEYGLLKSLQIDSKRLLYSDPIKVPDHIKKTRNGGVDHFAFDSVSEIKKLAELAPGAGACLRLKVSDYGSIFPLSEKFGVGSNHAVAYMDMAHELGLKTNGLTFHVGSQSESTHTWEVAFETAGRVIDRLSKVGINIEMLNIGGGFPATYTERIPSIKQLARVIERSIAKHIPTSVRIVAEPGRYISAEASVIVATVIGREYRGSSEWLFLDMGVFQGLMECLEIKDWRYPVFADRGSGEESTFRPFNLTGPSCDAYDTIGFDYMLPADIDVGDRIYIGAAGAYTTVYESNFNGFEPPKKYYIK